MGDGVPLALYRRDQLRRGLAPRTISAHASTLMAFYGYLGHPVLNATEEEIQSFLDSRRLSAASRSTYLATLRSFFRWALRCGLITADPTTFIQGPKLPRRIPRPIPEADLSWALEGASPRMRAWLLLAALEGLRCVEIAGLCREHILDDQQPPLLYIVGKGSHERLVPLNPLVEQALRDYGLPASGHLFLGEITGRPIGARNVSNYISQHLHRRGINSTAHKGRHRFATQVYRKTKDLRMTQELLGHASPATTAIYTACDMDEAAVVVNALSIGEPSVR